MKHSLFALLLLTLSACTSIPEAAHAPLSTLTTDGVTIHGDVFADGLDADAPLVLLFHQGGSSGRGEYREIAAWLNSVGFRAVAWDQRSGGDLHGVANRTVDGLSNDVASGYCDAYADLEAALSYVVDRGIAERVVVWGSSYSAALVFRLAAEHPERTLGVVAFSPASGGPLVACRARDWLDQLDVPALALRPGSEMERETSVEQRDIFRAAGVTFMEVGDGVHGSSMLLDARTDHDMSEVRAAVKDWLGAVVR